MNTGGRRGPLGPLFRGLACCALLIAALSPGLGAGSGHPSADITPTVVVYQSVSSVVAATRPTPTDQQLLPVVPAAVVVIAFVFVLVSRRRPAPIRYRQGRRTPGRAPPGRLSQP